MVKPKPFPTNDSTSIFKSIFLAILVGVTGFFAKHMIDEYSEGNTYFSQSNQPLTANDVPTLTICFKGTRRLEYEKDIWISSFTYKTDSIFQLKRGRNSIYDHYIDLKILILSPASYFTDCYTLGFEFKEDMFQQKIKQSSPWDRIFSFDLIKIHLAENTEHLSEIQLIITTKENSFGAVIYQWFDGEFDPVELTRGKHQFIHITRVRRYEYISGTCSKNTFFECVESQLKHFNTCYQNGESCSPFSIPNGNITCETNNTSCWQDVTDLGFPSCMAKKSCKVQEYHRRNQHVFDFTLPNEKLVLEHYVKKNVPSKVLKQLIDPPDKTILLSVSFDETDWSKADRTKELKVEVFKEHYVLNTFSLVGNVGGQMGLMIGFSFLGCFGWLTSWVKLVWKNTLG